MPRAARGVPVRTARDGATEQARTIGPRVGVVANTLGRSDFRPLRFCAGQGVGGAG